MKPYYQDDLITIIHGDCREILPSLSGISAVVTDCPYELGFMGKSWDSKGISFQLDTWRLIRDTCLPGAMLLSFSGTRTSHRIVCAIEDAGWQIRDTICWVYGSGFPKSLDISKAIDKKAGIWRGKRGKVISENLSMSAPNYQRTPRENAATPEAKLWEGYGTALKPAYEPIILAMNPLDGTFANNALKHKVAGLNIDECRIEALDQEVLDAEVKRLTGKKATGWKNTSPNGIQPTSHQGRFPSNFIHDGSQEVMELFPDSKGMSGGGNGRRDNSMFGVGGVSKPEHIRADSGSAARFFYCAKASRKERDAELEDMPIVRKYQDTGTENRIFENINVKIRNSHPTVKPLALMSYLCKLVKMPEYNLILDPFCGSGTTLLACKKLGIPSIGIDSNEEYCEIASKRLLNPFT